MERSRTTSDAATRSRPSLEDVPEEPADLSNDREIAGAVPNVTRNASQLRRSVDRMDSGGISRHSSQRTARSHEGNRSTRTSEDVDSTSRDKLRNPTKPPGAESDWVDAEYYETNPWYGQSEMKPVFSLGRTLPHRARWATKQLAREGRDKEDLAELGEANPDEAGIPAVEKQETAETAQSTEPRMTTDGVAHSDRRNDVGQPVFEYIPSRTNTRSRRPTVTSNGPAGSRPDYGIDSEPLGQQENTEVEQGNMDPNEFRNWWARVRVKHREPLAEFLATCVAIFMGLSGTLSVDLSGNQYGTYETACWAWGFAWMFGIYLGGGVSGAHMNPAISLSLSIFRGFPWRQCLIYVIVQFVAGIVAGALAYGVYRDTILHMDPTMAQTAKSFFSNPQPWVSPGTAFLGQVVGGAIMMIAVFALGDDQNNPPGAGMHAFVLGLLVTILKMTLGYNTGSALNPASDFGPRVVAYAAGYREMDVFQTKWWFYGPWLATLVGSIIGCSIYDGFIFVGSESPINYRVPKRFQKRVKRIFSFGMVKDA